jgi:hypothetical protein
MELRMPAHTKVSKENIMRKLFVIATTVAVFLTVRPLFASESIVKEPNNHLNRTDTEIHAVLGDGDLGAGFRFSIPIVSQGFVSAINDNVDISFGADILNWPSPDYEVTGVVVPVMLQWNFYLSRDWSVFGEGGVAFQNWFAQRANGDNQTFFVWPGISVGARYYFNPGNYPALVIRLGYPSGLSVGIGF